MRSGRIVLPLFGFMTFLLLTCSPTSAGTINVLGFVDIRGGPSGDATLNLGGDHGFTLNGTAQFFSVGPQQCIGIFNPFCSPGATLSLGASSGGSDVSAGATFQGVSYFVGGVGCGTSGSTPCGNLRIDFVGQTVVPPFGDFTKAILKEPVLFGATFFHLEEEGPFGSSEQLVASAIATLTLDKVENSLPQFAGPAWRFESIQYELEPIPEPTTLLLFGTAMAGLGLARWRQRRQAKHVASPSEAHS
jgi:hypothetical protein